MSVGSTLRIAVIAIAACGDPAAPRVVESGVVFTYPIDAQLDVPLGARVVVTFSDPVDASAIAACEGTTGNVTGAFCLVGPDGPVDATAEVVGDGRTVQLAGVAFAPGTTYEVYVRTALAPTATNLPASGPLFRFTTRSTQPRAARATLIAVNGGPPEAPEAFRPMFESSTIRLVFSEPLDPRSVVLAPDAIELVDMASGAAVPVTLLAQGIHVSLDPIADLAPGTPYQLKIGFLVVDVGHESVVPAAITLVPQATGAGPPIREMLRTRQPGDPGPSASQAGADRNLIAIDTSLIGKTTAAVLPSVLAAELSDPTALGGPIAFTLRRGQRLQASGLDVKLGGEVPAGLSTGTITIELLTDGGGRLYRNPYRPDAERPDNDRAPLFADLSLDLAVYATDPAGNAVLTQTVLGVQGVGVVAATDGVLDIEAVIAIDLDLLGVARAPTNLVLELITDPSAAIAADPSIPVLLASLPGATEELDVDAGIELVFDRPIDLDRARAGGIRLEHSGEPPIATVIESHGAALVIRPVNPLVDGISYRVVLDDVADLAGNQLAATAPIDVATPVVTTTNVPMAIASLHPGVPCALIGGDASSPGRCAGGGTGDDRYQPFLLAANEPIEIRFTQPARASSLTSAPECNGGGSARIAEIDAGGACVAVVAGTWIQRARALSFVPDRPWQVGTRYRLTLVSGSDINCAASEICGIVSPASFDVLGGNLSSDAGGPDLVIEFTGAAATAATLVTTQAAPWSDINGSGIVDASERNRDENRVALQIVGTTGVVTAASFHMPDCLPAVTGPQACMYLAGALPVELLPLAHDCPLPGGGSAASCMPVAVSPQVMFGTSLALDASAVIGMSTVSINTVTGMFVLRIREPAGGPVTGYLIDDAGTPTLVIALELYLDAPDMSVPLLDDDMHSKPLSVSLRGPLRFLPDGRISIAVTNIADLPIRVGITGEDHGQPVAGSVDMVIPQGEMKLSLVSPPLRGGPP